MRNEPAASLLKSILHNIGVVAVGFVVALIGTGIDRLLGIRGFALIRREERQLHARFGDAWVRYARRVRRWI